MVIEKNDDVNRPPRSYDLTLLDFFVAVTGKVYKNNRESFLELKDEISRVMGELVR